MYEISHIYIIKFYNIQIPQQHFLVAKAKPSPLNNENCNASCLLTVFFENYLVRNTEIHHMLSRILQHPNFPWRPKNWRTQKTGMFFCKSQNSHFDKSQCIIIINSANQHFLFTEESCHTVSCLNIYRFFTLVGQRGQVTKLRFPTISEGFATN